MVLKVDKFKSKSWDFGELLFCNSSSLGKQSMDETLGSFTFLKLTNDIRWDTVTSTNTNYCPKVSPPNAIYI